MSESDVHPNRESLPFTDRADALDTVGEVIASGSTRFTAQCPRPLLHRPPVFGAFVRIFSGTPAALSTAPVVPPQTYDPFADPAPRTNGELPAGIPDNTLYAVVFSAGTGSAEPGRRPTAYGLNEDDLRRQQPQIFDLLATEFSALHVGFARNGRFRAGIPPRPGRLHSAVSACTPDEVIAITDAPEFLRSLVTATSDIPTDELIVACVRQAYESRAGDYPSLVRMGKQLASLLRNDPDRLTALLARLEP